MRFVRRVVVGLAMCVCVAKVAGAGTYKFVDLHPGNPPYDETYAAGISNGQAVGYGHWTGSPDLPPGPAYRALLWTAPQPSSYVDLSQPDSKGPFYAYGAGDGQQVGTLGGGFDARALLWTGSADSMIDLTPTAFKGAAARHAAAGQQVGIGYLPDDTAHALLWRGSADNFVDLHPAGFVRSFAQGTDGTHQVGHGSIDPQSVNSGHALLWSGSADTAVDLHPSGFIMSYAYRVSGNQQVGWGFLPADPNALERALLWTGSADSAIDLTPPDALYARAMDTNGIHQVGAVKNHAALWTGSADSMVDLHAFLPAGYQASLAVAIDANGIIVGNAWATGSRTKSHVVMWIPVPEPGSLGVIAISSLALLRRRVKR